MKFRVSGAGTLHPDHFLWHLAIRRAADLAGGWAIGPEHLFELQTVDHVREAGAAVFAQPGLVVEVVARCHND